MHCHSHADGQPLSLTILDLSDDPRLLNVFEASTIVPDVNRGHTLLLSHPVF